jgi:hypothetical protein
MKNCSFAPQITPRFPVVSVNTGFPTVEASAVLKNTGVVGYSGQTGERGMLCLVDGLDTHRHGWRIRHPQAMTNYGQYDPHPQLLACCRESIQFRGHGSGAKENAPGVPSIVRHCLAATRSAMVRLNYGEIPMIFTFAITRCRGPIAALPAIRTISVYATNETEARSRLAGLPLVFLSRSPAKVDA